MYEIIKKKEKYNKNAWSKTESVALKQSAYFNIVLVQFKTKQSPLQIQKHFQFKNFKKKLLFSTFYCIHILKGSYFKSVADEETSSIYC